MATANINVRVDADLKKAAEDLFDDLGLNMSSAITMFLVKVARERRIPFEISADPFYSAANMAELERRAVSIKNGTSTLKEHDLIEVED